MNVKPMIESTILSGDYELDKILSSIDLYHIEGSLTDEERRELIARCVSGITAAMGNLPLEAAENTTR